MASSLESLLSEGVISEIYGRLKSGKEADVYAVAYGDAVVAAKVYKDRAQRSFKSNATYKEGRAVRNTRSQRAMDRGSKFGQEAAEDAWKSAEATALYKLHAAGVRVPTPVLFLEGVLFMELVRGVDGEAAPRLIDTDLSPEQARNAYMDMLSQLVRILSCDLIHGDLSPYNVLWAVGGATIIDFPQIISAAQNSNSETFFVRDARNILGHFADIDRSLQARLNSDTREIWRAYVRRELSPDFMPSGRPPAPEPRPRFSSDDRARDPRPPQQDRGPRPEQQTRGPRPPQQDRGPRPPSQNRPPQQQQQQRGYSQQQQRGPQSQAPQRNRGPQEGRGPNDNRGPQQGRGSNDNRGPQEGRGPNDNRGPQQGRGPNDNRGPQEGRGPNDNRGPQEGRGPNDNRGPQQGRGPNDNRGPQPNRDGRNPNQRSGTRPALNGDQNRTAPGPGARLHMASARANIASQPTSPGRRPQRGAQRGPEVIVLTRRAPEAATAPVDRREEPAQSERDGSGANRRRR